jgi:hypothetical protein
MRFIDRGRFIGVGTSHVTVSLRQTGDRVLHAG